MDRRIDGLEDWIAVSMFICIAAIGVAIIFVVAIDGEHNRRGDVDIHNSNGRLYRRRGDVNCCGFVRRRDDLVITAATPIYIQSLRAFRRPDSRVQGQKSRLHPTSYFLVPTSYVLRLTYYFLLLTSYFLLRTSYFLLLTSSYFLLLTSYFLLLTSYFLLLTSDF